MATGVFAPIPRRRVGGIRVRLEDNKGFITFLNQRDLEIILGLAEPGDYCEWLDALYVDASHADWIGFLCDAEDLEDDLHETELELRADFEILPDGIELSRRVHIYPGNDIELMSVLINDVAPDTGESPDPRLSTVGERWATTRREKIRWERVH